jgi:hypothetical protein
MGHGGPPRERVPPGTTWGTTGDAQHLVEAGLAGKPSAPGGADGLPYCRAGPRDPGQVIAVSPVEPTQQATRCLC